MLDLSNFSDSDIIIEKNLREKPLILPINTLRKPRMKRIQEIHEHFKTQCLFGLEFDLKHLQVVSDGEQSSANKD